MFTDWTDEQTSEWMSEGGAAMSMEATESGRGKEAVF